MGLLSGKAVVVTGAGRGLGRAYALALADEGAAVVVNDIDGAAAAAVARELAECGATGLAHPGSVADWDAAAALIACCERELGAIDGLVNNAGLLLAGPAWDADPARLRRLVEVNVLGTLYCGAHALRAMVARRRGAIVNVTSGAHLGMAGLSAYGATKGAVASLTYGWALEAQPFGVRVNAFSPVARTAMSVDPMADEPPPEAVAPVVAFLLSDRAAGITGQVVRCDADGVSLLAPPRRRSVAAPLAAAHSAATLADAFDARLRAALEPVGLGARGPEGAQAG